jgi:hypothetical protein
MSGPLWEAAWASRSSAAFGSYRHIVMMTEEQSSGIQPTWFHRIRSMAPWVALIAFFSFVIPHILIERFEPNAFKWAIGAPRPPSWQFAWRIISLFVLMVASLLSLPKWRALIPLVLSLALLAYASYGI